MSPCVPKWDLDVSSAPVRHTSPPHNPDSPVATATPLGYEITEQPWENGQLPMHGLGEPCVATRHASERPPAATGMLESIVNLATQNPEMCDNVDDDVLVPWYVRNGHQTSYQATGRVVQAAAAATVTMDAQVPTQATKEEEGAGVHVAPRSQGLAGWFATCKAGRVAELAPRVPVLGEWSRDKVSVSGKLGRDSWHVPTNDKCQKELGGFGSASTPICSQWGTNYVEGRKKEKSKSFLWTKRSRAADVHNQSERKRRDKINQKMRMLQKMVPDSSKTDKASILDEVIDYMKQLQAQLTVITRMSMQSVMMPSTVQRQLHMSIMNPRAHIAMGKEMDTGVGMAIDFNVNSIMPQNPTGLPPVVNPANAFMPTVFWDGARVNGRELPSQAAISPTNPPSTYLVSQSQPVTMEAYSRMIALMHQQQQEHQDSTSNE